MGQHQIDDDLAISDHLRCRQSDGGHSGRSQRNRPPQPGGNRDSPFHLPEEHPHPSSHNGGNRNDKNHPAKAGTCHCGGW